MSVVSLRGMQTQTERSPTHALGDADQLFLTEVMAGFLSDLVEKLVQASKEGLCTDNLDVVAYDALRLFTPDHIRRALLSLIEERAREIYTFEDGAHENPTDAWNALQAEHAVFTAMYQLHES